MPCHNEGSVIERKLDNCLSLLAGGQAEVTVVDDYSSDDTASKVINWQARHCDDRAADVVRLLRNRNRAGKNAALRTAFEQASGEILLITDADILLDSDVLARARAYFDRDLSIGGLCLTPRITSESSRTASRYVDHYERFNRRLKMIQSRLDSVPILHGQAMFVRRSMHVIPHDDLPADDVDFALQVRIGGYRVRYAADVPFYEVLAPDSRLVFSQKVRRAKAVMRSLWYHRRLLLNPRFGWFGLLCYPMDFVLYFIVAPGMAAAGLTGFTWLVVRHGAAGAAAGVVALAVAALLAPLSRILRFVTILLTSQIAILVEERPRIRWMTNRQT